MEEVQFGIYELELYATAQEEYNALIEYKEEYFESLYDEVRPAITVFDEEQGKVYLSGQDTEVMALWIIDQKEGYNIKVERAKKRMELFNEAFATLTEEEQQLIQNYYHDGELIPRNEYRTFAQAQDKIIRYLKGKKQKEMEKRKRKRKERIKEMVREWKNSQEQ